MSGVLALILGGGKGTRLHPLTQFRSKPAVPFGSQYRLIDIPISNCIHSDCRRIYVLTQYLSTSLHRHIANTYKFDPFSSGFVEILAAMQTNDTADWYRGTADAVRQNLRTIKANESREILILSGDQIYRMDYRDLVRTHRESRADVTVAVLPVGAEKVSGLGIVRLDDSGRVIGFVEKPTRVEQLAPVRTPSEWLVRRGLSAERPFLGNMGIYLFRRNVLFELLANHPTAVDFGKEVFPRCLKTCRVQAHLFEGYWEDVGTIKTYHEANLALAGPKPLFSFQSAEGMIFTRMRFLPPPRFGDVRLSNCLIGEGSEIADGAVLERAVVGVRSRIGRGVMLRDSIILGANRLESNGDSGVETAPSSPGIGDGTVLERVIVDKNCRIGRDVRIVNLHQHEEFDGEDYVIRDGITVIPRGTTIADGRVI